MVTVVTGEILVFIASFLILKPYFVAWSSRGFLEFENSWPKIFMGGGAFAVISSLLAWWKSDNLGVALIFGLMAGFFAIAAWTDGLTGMIPSEISDLTTWLAFAFMAGSLFLNMPMPHLYFTYLPLILPATYLTFVAGCVGVILLMLLTIKKVSFLFWTALFIGFTALFLIGYASIDLLIQLPQDPYWRNLGLNVMDAYLFLSAIALFDLLAGHGMGKADMKLLYAAGFAFAWWVSWYYLFVIMLVAMVIQMIVHLFGKRLDLGRLKTMNNSGLRQLWVNWKNKDKAKEDIPTTHVSLAIPFLPILAFTIIGGVMVLI